MSVVFGFKDLRDILIELGIGDFISSIKEGLNNLKVQKLIIGALNEAINSDPVLSAEAKDELTSIFNNKRHIVAFLEAASEMASGTFDPKSESGKSEDRLQFDRSWNYSTRDLKEETHAIIWLRLLSAVIKASTRTLSINDQLLFGRLDLLQIQLMQHQKEILQVFIDQINQPAQKTLFHLMSTEWITTCQGC